MLTRAQLCAANYHYKRYSLSYFLASAERLGYEAIELWASGPHLHLADFDNARLSGLAREISGHHLKLACLTPEQCLSPISVSHPDKAYRERSISFFERHIEAAALLGCGRMVVSTGLSYLDSDLEEAFGWCVEAFGRICRKAEREGVALALEPFTKYTTHICNQLSQLVRLMEAVGSPALGGLADTGVIATTGADTFDSFVRRLGPGLLHVHFVDGTPGGHLVPGDGCQDLEGALRTLAGTGYQGYLGLEILDRRYVMEPEEAMRRAMEWYCARALC